MKKVKRLALSAVGASLGVILLYIGSLIEVLDISSACLVSLIVLFFASETGAFNAFAVYAVISILSVFLLPIKLPAIIFALIFGLMPVIKRVCGKLSLVLNIAVKFIIYNSGATILYFISGELLGIPKQTVWIIAYFICCNALFVFCDLLYTRLDALYYIRIRPKITKYLK